MEELGEWSQEEKDVANRPRFDGYSLVRVVQLYRVVWFSDAGGNSARQDQLNR